MKETKKLAKKTILKQPSIKAYGQCGCTCHCNCVVSPSESTASIGKYAGVSAESGNNYA